MLLSMCRVNVTNSLKTDPCFNRSNGHSPYLKKKHCQLEKKNADVAKVEDEVVMCVCLKCVFVCIHP